MAIGNIRYQAEFDTIYGANYKIRIYDEDFVGSATNFKVQTPGFTIKYDGEGKERNDTIKASSCSIMALSEDSAFDTFLNDIIQGNQNRFRVEILREDQLYWRGTILQDVGSQLMTDFPKPITLRAVCGLSLLKNVDFDKDIYTGINNKQQHISFIQNMLRYYTNTYDFYQPTDIFLKTSVNWYEDSQPTPAAAIDPLEYSRTEIRAFREWDSGGKKISLSAYNVISNLCRVWGARICQSRGVWFFVQESAYRNNTNYREYRPGTTTPSSNGVISDFVSRAGTKQDNEAFIILEGAKQAYYPKVIKTNAIYGDWGNWVLWGGPYDLQAGTAPSLETNLGTVTTGEGNQIAINFNAYIDLPITYEDPVSGVFYWNPIQQTSQYYLIIRLIIKVGSYYFTNMGWTTTPGNYVVWTQVGYLGSSLMSDPWFYYPVEIYAPDIPVDGDFEFGAYFQIYNGNFSQDANTAQFQAATSVSFTPSPGNTDGAPFGLGTIQFITDNEINSQMQFSSSILGSANSELDLGIMRVGDGPESLSWGRIEVSNDLVNWTQGTESAWQGFGTGTVGRITQILTEQFQAGQTEFIPIIQSTFIQKPTSSESMEFGDAIQFDGQKYIPNGWTYNAYNETYQGEWYLSTSDFSAITNSTSTTTNQFFILMENFNW